MRFKLGVLAAFGAVAIAVPGSGAGIGLPPLSTDQQVYTYLASIGVDPTGVVIQRGARNYAGPSCPGPGWNCTTATRVVQIATEEGENDFECELPPPEGGNAESSVVVRCMVVARNGQTQARCVERAEDMPGVLLLCTLDLEGENVHAYVDQTAIQNEGAEQTATVKADVDMTATIDNHLVLDQTVKQTSDVGGSLSVLSGAQSQDGHLLTEIDQDAGNNNYAHFVQELDQRGNASGADVSQQQTGQHQGDVSQTAPVEGSGGNHFEAHQTERQVLSGDGAQSQSGPQFCCASQIGNEQNSSLHIHQDSFQRANQPTADQNSSTIGHYDTAAGDDLLSAASPFDTGPSKFMILHHLANNVDRITAQESGPGFHQVTTTCQSLADYYEEAGCFSTADDGDLDLVTATVPASEWP